MGAQLIVRAIGLDDYVWTRILDVPTSLGARRYAADGRNSGNSRNGKRTIRVPKDMLNELVIRSKYALLRPVQTYTDQRGGKHSGHPFCWNKEGDIHRSLPKTLEKPIRAAAQWARGWFPMPCSIARRTASRTCWSVS